MNKKPIIYYGVFNPGKDEAISVFRELDQANKVCNYLTKLNEFKYVFEVDKAIEIPFGNFKRYKEPINTSFELSEKEITMITLIGIAIALNVFDTVIKIYQIEEKSKNENNS